MTCWRRLRDWQRAGVWDLIHFALLDWLARKDQIDWSRAVVDSCSIRAVHGGDHTGPNPTDRAKRGSKRHLICDGRGVPLAVRLTGANRNDSQEALALVDAIPPLHGERGRPRQRPDCVLGDRGYDAAAIRRGLGAPYRPVDRYASYCAREWVRSLAVGRGADVCVAQSVPTLARPLRQAGRHPRGVPLARVRPDLLAIAGQDMENRLRPMPSFSGVHRRGRCVSEEIKLCGLLGGGSRWQALDIGKRNGVYQESSRRVRRGSVSRERPMPCSSRRRSSPGDRPARWCWSCTPSDWREARGRRRGPPK